MPPRIPIQLPLRTLSSRPANCKLHPKLIAPAIKPFSSSANRPSTILSSLSDNRSAYHKRVRLGRGPSSGKGKTSGRGHKGQKQHGKVPRGFEGGQTPLSIVHGPRGFKNVHAEDIQTVPLTRIQSWVAQGRLDPTRPITIRDLALSGCVTSVKDGVKLLSRSLNEPQPILDQPLNIVVSRASASAIEAVEKAGGRGMTRFYTRWAIRRILRGTMDPINSLRSGKNPDFSALQSSSSAVAGEVPAPPTAPVAEPALSEGKGFAHRLPDPTSRKDIEYYRDPKHRGYLAHTVGEGQSPSLFFKAPGAAQALAKAGVEVTSKKKKLFGSENKLW